MPLHCPHMIMGESEMTQGTRARPDRMREASSFIYIVAAICLVGAVVGGAQLITTTDQGCAEFTCTPSHPFTGAGWALLIGGCLQAGVFFVVGRLCFAVSELRRGVVLLEGDDDLDELPPPESAPVGSAAAAYLANPDDAGRHGRPPGMYGTAT